jgi:hypothetical protein
LADALTSWIVNAGSEAARHEAAPAAAAAAAAVDDESDTAALLAECSGVQRVLKHPNVAAMLTFQVARAARALHQARQGHACGSFSSSSSGSGSGSGGSSSGSSSVDSGGSAAASSSGQAEHQQQQHQVGQAADTTPLSTTSKAPHELYQLLFEATGVPGLVSYSYGSSSNSSSSSSSSSSRVGDSDTAAALSDESRNISSASGDEVVSAAMLPLHALTLALKQQQASMIASQPLDSSSDANQSTGCGPIMLQQMLASVLLLLPLSGGSIVTQAARDTLRLMALVLEIHMMIWWAYRQRPDGTREGSPVAEALLPLLLHSIVPAVAAMLQQGQAEQGSTAGAAAAAAVQAEQQLLAELGMGLGSLAAQIILAGEAGGTMHSGSDQHAGSTRHAGSTT